MPRQDSEPAAVLDFLRPAALYAAPAAASMLTFGLGLTAAQGAGMALRVSSATPLLGSALGALGVGAASAAAGQAFRQMRASLEPQPRPTRRQRQQQPSWWAGVRRLDLLVDAVGGMLLWRALGGRWSGVMPSDLFQPGALARRSLPARSVRIDRKRYGPLYGNASELKKVGQFYDRDGCHHCGRRSGDAIADHIPPNVKVFGSGYREALLSNKPGSSGRTVKGIMKALGVQRPNEQVEELLALFDTQSRRKMAALRRAQGSRTQRFGLLQRAVRRVRKLLRLPVGPPAQRLFPQCRPCSVKQGAAARSGARTLVWHNAGLLRPRPHHLAGVAVGLRYLHSWSDGGSSGRKQKKRQHGSIGSPPDWWREFEPPTLPPPIRDWGSGGSRGARW